MAPKTRRILNGSAAPVVRSPSICSIDEFDNYPVNRGGDERRQRVGSESSDDLSLIIDYHTFAPIMLERRDKAELSHKNIASIISNHMS